MRAVEAPPPPEEQDQIMPETPYTKAFDWLITHTTNALQRAHAHASTHMARVDQHVGSSIACWQQQHPWLVRVALQRRSALRFRVVVVGAVGGVQDGGVQAVGVQAGGVQEGVVQEGGGMHQELHGVVGERMCTY